MLPPPGRPPAHRVAHIVGLVDGQVRALQQQRYSLGLVALSSMDEARPAILYGTQPPA